MVGAVPRSSWKLPASAVVAGALLVAALFLPDRCGVNELGHHRQGRLGDLRLGEVPRGAPQVERLARACPPRPEPLGPPGPPVRRAPYLQIVTSVSADVLWTADRLADPAVAVWTPGAAGQPRLVRAAIDPAAPLPRGHQYAAHVAGLDPGAVHCYEVRDGSRRLAGPFGFATAPAPGDVRPIRLIAFGDMGHPTVDQRMVLAQMARLEFDLVLLAGDIAYPDGRLAELERNFFAVYAPLMHGAPFFPASGNHDYITDDAAPFRQAFALPENGAPLGRERWYSFDWGDLHVVVLDSERLDADQAEWLEADLTAHAAARWTIVLFHRAPFSSGEHGPDLPTRDAFVPILTRHRVPLVVTGHEHDYERFRPKDGVTFIVTGGGGRGTRRLGEAAADSAFAAQVAHFVWIVVEPERIRLWAVDASGQTFDTAEIVHDGRPARSLRR